MDRRKITILLGILLIILAFFLVDGQNCLLLSVAFTWKNLRQTPRLNVEAVFVRCASGQRPLKQFIKSIAKLWTNKNQQWRKQEK